MSKQANAITLTDLEHFYATEIAALRSSESESRGMKNRNDIDIAFAHIPAHKRGYILHKPGALAEAMFSKWLVGEVVPLTVNEYRHGKPDVLGYEVRSKNVHTKPIALELYDRDRSKANLIHVLVVRHTQWVGEVVGWAWGHDVFNHGVAIRIANGGTKYMLSVSRLHDINTLPFTHEWIEYDNVG